MFNLIGILHEILIFSRILKQQQARMQNIQINKEKKRKKTKSTIKMKTRHDRRARTTKTSGDSLLGKRLIKIIINVLWLWRASETVKCSRRCIRRCQNSYSSPVSTVVFHLFLALRFLLLIVVFLFVLHWFDLI